MNPFKLAQQKAVKSLSTKTTSDLSWYGDRGWSSAYGGTQTDNTPPQNYERFVLDAYRKNAVVRACIQEIVTSLSEAPIRAYTDAEDGKRVWIPEHPLEELFENPNPRDSYIEFIERTGQHFFLGGNTIWEKKRASTRRLSALIPIRPDHVVSADADADGFPIRYHIRLPNGKTRTVDVDDIVHIPDIDPLNEIFGMPRLLAALTEVSADNEATAYVNQVLHNHGSPGTVVAVDSERIRGQGLLERAEAKWEEKFSGSGRGKVAFLPGAHTVKEIGFNLKDLEFKPMREVARSSICAVFGVDPMILGLSARGSSLNGSEHLEARRKLWTQTIIPLIRRWEAEINTSIAPEYGNIKAGFDLSRIAALQEARSEAIERGFKMAKTGVVTAEEIREEMSLDSQPDDGTPVVIGGRTMYAPFDRLVENPHEKKPTVKTPKREEEENEEEES